MILLPCTDEAIRKAAQAIRNGEVVVFPTETLYGLAADATNEAAVKKVFEIKRRPPDKPTPVLVTSIEMVSSIVSKIPLRAEALMKRFWPGPLTIVFDARPTLPSILTAGTGTIGIRISSGDVARKLVEIAGIPITATSANISGEGDASDPSYVKRSLEGVSIMLDAGKLKNGPGSSVVDARGDELKIIRQGEIPTDELLKIWNG